MDPHTGVLPGLKAMVYRATRWKFAWQQSPLAACPQEVKDGVEDGTKVGGARLPARSRRWQNRRNKSPRRVGQFGVVESSAHRTGPFEPDQRSFKTDVNFSNTLSITSWNRITGPSNAGCVQASIFAPSGELGARSPATKRFI